MTGQFSLKAALKVRLALISACCMVTASYAQPFIDLGDPLTCPDDSVFWFSNTTGSYSLCLDPRDDGSCNGQGQDGENGGAGCNGSCDVSGRPEKEECDGCRDPQEGGGQGPNAEAAAQSSTEAGKHLNPDQGCCDPQEGMPVWSVEQPLLSVRLVDIPMWYQPSIGPKISLKLHYKSREGEFGYGDTRQANIFGFGPGWSTPWRSYIRARSGSSPSEVWVIDGVGNVRRYGVTSTTDNNPKYHPKTGAYVETWTGPGGEAGFALKYFNGAKDIYAQEVENSNANGVAAGDMIYFVSRREDTAGRGISFNYSSNNVSGSPQLRLASVVDAGGLTNTLVYTNVGAMKSLIHKVTNPHGFGAVMTYDGSGRLNSITDTISLTSTMSYDGSDRVTSVKTPYGTNRFEYISLSDTNCLAVRVVEKEVRKHLFVFGDLPVNPWTDITNTMLSLSNYVFMATNAAPPVRSFFLENIDDLKGRYSIYGTNHPSARSSGYWGPLQYQNLPSAIKNALDGGSFAISTLAITNYNLAHMKRWRRAKGGNISNTKSFERFPGAKSDGTDTGPYVFYNYDTDGAHPGGSKEGFDNLLSQVFRQTSEPDPYNSNIQVWDLTQKEYYSVGSPGANSRPGYVSQEYSLERPNFPEASGGSPDFCFVGTKRRHIGHAGCIGTGCSRWVATPLQEEQTIICTSGSTSVTNWFTASLYLGGFYDLVSVYPGDPSTGGGGAFIDYDYDSTTKELTKVTYQGVAEKVRSFNTDGQLISEVFQNSAGGTVKLWTNSWTYLRGFVRTFTDPRGMQVTVDTDPMGRVTKIAYPDSTFTSNRYDRLDLVETIDRNGFSTTYTYDAHRKLIGVTNAVTNSFLLSYCDCGSLASTTDGNGQTTTFTYDNRGRRTQTSLPGGSWVASKFNAWNQPTNITTSGGIEQGVVYNLRGQVRERWLKSGGSWKCVLANLYDVQGHLITTTNANGLALNFEHDDYGRITKTIYPDSTFDSRTYTTNGIQTVTDAAGHSTTYAYDFWGRPKSVTSPMGDTVSFGLDPASDLSSLTNESSAVTRWVYDLYGRVSRKLDATGKTNFVYTYDPGGRLTNQMVPSIIAAAFVSTSYSYDKVGNVTNIVYPTAGQNVALAYDKNNRLVIMKDPLGTTTWSYTTFGKLASEDGPWSDDTIGYSYGADRRLQTMSISQEGGSAWSQAYTYDGFGRLDKITNPVGTFDYEWTGVSSGDWLGSLVKKLDLPFSNVRTNSYDSMGRRITTAALSGSTVLDSYNYVYANASRITRMNRNASEFANSNHLDFTYDGEGQLLTASGIEGSGSTLRVHEQWGYKYDPAGNLLQRTNGTGAGNQLVETFATNNLNQLISMGRNAAFTAAGRASPSATSVTVEHGGSVVSATRYADGSFARQGITLSNGNNTFIAVATDASSRSASQSVTLSLSTNLTFTYDARGNLSNDGKRRFVYNDRDELIEVYETNVWRSVFSYDGLRRMRVRKEFTWASNWSQTGEVRYVYSGTLPVQERNAVNQPVVTFTRGLDLSRTPSGAGGIGGLLARYDHSSVRGTLYHCDLGGNITALFSSNQVWARYSYDPYGNMQGSVGPLAEANRYRFSSKELHNNSGLLYYGYRFYDPNLQRWVNRDVIQESGGINQYGFAAGAPTTYIDSDGRYLSSIATGTAVSTAPGFLLGTPPGMAAALIAATFAEGYMLGYAAGDSLDLHDTIANKLGGPDPGSDPLPLPAGPPRPPRPPKRPTPGFYGDEDECHHRLPRQFKSEFERAGLDIEDYTVPMPRGLHRLTPDGIHPNGYNGAWQDFFWMNGNPTAGQILQQLRVIEQSFGISPTQGF